MSKLSDLGNGQVFLFVEGQQAKYLPANKGAYGFCDLDTVDYQEYEVVKKNEKSVKCRPLHTTIYYTFYFAGRPPGVTSTNPEILKKFNPVNCEVKIKFVDY